MDPLQDRFTGNFAGLQFSAERFFPKMAFLVEKF